MKYKQDTLGINITKDVVRFDYTVAMDDKNRIYIYNLILYISIGILIILIVLLINYILKVKRKNKIMNRL